LFVPGVRQGFHVPQQLQPYLLAATAVTVTLIAWAVIAPGHISTETQYAPGPAARAGNVHSVAFSVAKDGYDVVLVRRADAEVTGTAREVARFPIPVNDLHLKGSAAPTADRLAVLTASSQSPTAALTLLTLPGGMKTNISGDFDYLSRIAWAADGGRVALTTSKPDGPTTVSADVVEVDSGSGGTHVAAHFASAFAVEPVGYSLDGTRLYVVTIDQSGSTLWSVRDGKAEKSAPLSAGPTRDWTLSPDGSRLAYVDIATTGEVSYTGRTLLIATGAVSNSLATANQFGSAFEPGSQIPVFGGPGGSVQLEADAGESAYLVPASWSPDGSMLVATIFSASGDNDSSPSESVELVTWSTADGSGPQSKRVSLAEASDARFLGWVVD
jgi:hypothetical protein